MTDDQRADGNLDAMPKTRSWLEEGGIRFRKAFATSTLCCPRKGIHPHGTICPQPRHPNEGDLIQQLHIHLVPVLLVQGIRLFEHLGHDPIELERTSAIPTPAATHLTFRARGQGE